MCYVVYVCVCVYVFVCVCSVNCTKILMMRAAENRVLGKLGVYVNCGWFYERRIRTSRIQRSVLTSPAVSCGNISYVARNGTARWERSLKSVLDRKCVRPFRIVC